jgi:hypothetical protein
LQPDGKILLAGAFTNLWGQQRKYLARLNANCTLDTNFTAGADFLVQTLAVQADGKILVGGSFSALAGVNRSCIGRLNSTNSLAISNPVRKSDRHFASSDLRPTRWSTSVDSSADIKKDFPLSTSAQGAIPLQFAESPGESRFRFYHPSN